MENVARRFLSMNLTRWFNPGNWQRAIFIPDFEEPIFKSCKDRFNGKGIYLFLFPVFNESGTIKRRGIYSFFVSPIS
jgi:hypothetical protein